MKKIVVFTFCLFLVLPVSGVFADNDVTSSGGQLTLGSTAGASTNPQLIIGLSPKVVARYVTDGDSTVTAQWYAIGTVHPGGNLGYGTAQNLNNIYFMKYETGAATSTILDELPTTANSASDWSTSWDM